MTRELLLGKIRPFLRMTDVNLAKRQTRGPSTLPLSNSQARQRLTTTLVILSERRICRPVIQISLSKKKDPTIPQDDRLRAIWNRLYAK